MSKRGPKPVNLIGLEVGRLRVKAFAGRSERGDLMWKCKCECGNITYVRSDSLKSKRTRSCGCLDRWVQFGIIQDRELAKQFQREYDTKGHR